jgi:hypothetical protein
MSMNTTFFTYYERGGVFKGFNLAHVVDWVASDGSIRINLADLSPQRELTGANADRFLVTVGADIQRRMAA